MAKQQTEEYAFILNNIAVLVTRNGTTKKIEGRIYHKTS